MTGSVFWFGGEKLRSGGFFVGAVCGDWLDSHLWAWVICFCALLVGIFENLNNIIMINIFAFLFFQIKNWTGNLY